MIGEANMESADERRREKRLHYSWPLWFAENFNEMLTQGQMFDVSSGGAAFTCYSHEQCPYQGQNLTARFSIPRFSDNDGFEMGNFTRQATVQRVDHINDMVRKVAITFSMPLPFQPGHQGENEFDMQQKMQAVTI